MLSLEQKLYQLIISRFDGEKLPSSPYQEQAVDLVKKGIGGFIIFGGKIDELRDFINRLQTIAGIPLFIASDIERGVGQQIEGATRFPNQMAVAAAINKYNPDDVEILHDAVLAIAREAVDTGINMPLIPVLDVNRNPDNPIICTRAFSDDPEEVAWYGKLYIRILEEAGLISCAKHFPGHGDTAIDSHIELPVISKSLTDLTETDIFPFKEAVKAGVSSVMIGHLSIPAIDTLPASLSEKVITGLLRKELGFEGLVLTDALNMHALKEFGDVASRCINAGADILLHPADADLTVKELKDSISSGMIEERKIDAAVKRILKYKSGNKKERMPDQLRHDRNKEISQTISDKSIALVKSMPDLQSVKNANDIQLVIIGEDDMQRIDALVNTYSLFNSELRTPDPEPQSLLFAVFTNVSAWRGTSGIKEDDIRRIKGLMAKARYSIVVSFGSPYVLRHFDNADILIAAYDTTEQAQLSVIKCLNGEKNFQGRLPVRGFV